MKKVISCFFVFMITVLILDIYCAIVGAIDVKNAFDALVAKGVGGIKHLGAGLDVVVFGIVLISLVVLSLKQTLLA